jgi:hypothetical protein
MVRMYACLLYEYCDTICLRQAIRCDLCIYLLSYAALGCDLVFYTVISPTCAWIGGDCVCLDPLSFFCVENTVLILFSVSSCCCLRGLSNICTSPDLIAQ